MAKRIAIYPGSFDPITNGHLSIIERGIKLFDTIIVAVTNNPHKKHTFNLDERMGLIRASIRDGRFSEDEQGHIEVTQFSGMLLSEYANAKGACAVLRGLRAVTDFEAEFQMALTNQALEPAVETVFVMTRHEHLFISSSMVREIASYPGGDVRQFVPKCVVDAFAYKANERRIKAMEVKGL